MRTPFYNPLLAYEENFDNGPFGEFADGKVFSNTGEPKHKFLGYKVYSPFGIAAGPLLNSKFVKAAFDKGFDVVCYKTQRSTFFPCNPFPNVLFVEVDGDLTVKKAEESLIGSQKTKKNLDRLTITNSFGNPSRGPKFWQSDMKKAVKMAKKGQLLIASVVGTIKTGESEKDYYEDFAKTAQLAKKSGAKVVEVNLSCPNVTTEGVVCYTPGAVLEICRLTREKIGQTPLLAKIGYFLPKQQLLLEKIIKSILPFVSGISAINTLAAPVVDKQGNQALPGENRLKSGICGAAIKWAGMDMVRRLVALRKKLKADFAIIGVGGVMFPNDFLDYRKAGADLVMSATAAMWNPNLAVEIKQLYQSRV
ncbi:hypothetical protein HYT17_01230 [Candidatus Microgenomates bacterium]|nr:hypothetical protein [Candidatus Microgenomates bacterium]